ncbi:uncharacterized protein LOC132261047 [Phlebotomus argentipes]|uniref:uncharacterized protein LOC132261047 n=1 Tax=Phlebotomus argentipes TaxID=94469 RepID=UPI0028930F0D|nr:uncharacterized protein LOC132261047 [Phlebotomus argentipes]
MQILRNKDLYQKTVEMVNNMGSFAGIDFLCRIVTKPITFPGYLLIAAINFSSVCTVYSTYFFRDNFTDLAYCLTTLGIIIMVLMKVISIFTTHNYAHDIIKEVNAIIDRLEGDHEKSSKIQKGLQAFQLTFNMVKVSYFAAGLGMILFALMNFAFKKERVLITGFIVPFLSHEETPGYQINLLLQAVEDMIAVIFLITYDSFYIGHMFIACTHKLTMTHFCKDFDKLLNENDELVNAEDAVKCLKALLLEHQSHLRLMRNISDMVNTSNVVHFLSNMCVVILSIVVLVKILWIPGVALLGVTVGNLFLYSAIGTLYSVCAEIFQAEVYNCKWYVFPPKIQKALGFVLAMSQRPVQPSVGGYAPLDLRTFLKCLKTIYTITMMLLNAE